MALTSSRLASSAMPCKPRLFCPDRQNRCNSPLAGVVFSILNSQDLPGGQGLRFDATDHSCCAFLQALQRLSDDAFKAGNGSSQCEGLIESVAEAIQLPAALRVKWLRADCCTCLDLSAPGDAWTPGAWHGIVMCLHAVPNVQQLHVLLPRVSDSKQWNWSRQMHRQSHRHQQSGPGLFQPSHDPDCDLSSTGQR